VALARRTAVVVVDLAVFAWCLAAALAGAAPTLTRAASASGPIQRRAVLLNWCDPCL
jgi:hypothetical protein